MSLLLIYFNITKKAATTAFLLFLRKVIIFRAKSTKFLIICIMTKNFLDVYNSFYFIGIGGVSMSALAKLLMGYGKQVAGSDTAENEYTRSLQDLGVRVDDQNFPPSVGDFDVIVYTDAINESNAQLREAVKLNKTIIPRGMLLFEVSLLYDSVIAVAGCHGKTTCTSMLAHIFDAAKFGFACHIGGNDIRYMNCYDGGSSYFITEACEYNKNFLRLKPKIAVILNSDADHLECYGSVDCLKQSYLQFAESASLVVSLYGDLNLKNAVTFGFDNRADYYAKGIKNEFGKFSFTAYEGEVKLGKVNLDVYGKHNVLNALAALAVARSVGIPFGDIAEGLNSFKGIERRFENIGAVNGAKVIADYAHHPNEIKATLRTVHLFAKGEVYVIFQPHTYSRTKNLFKQFVSVLSPLKNLLIYKTFAAREYYDDAGSALKLSQALKKSRYADSVQDIEDYYKKVHEGDVVLVLGAGDIYYLAKRALQNQNSTF